MPQAWFAHFYDVGAAANLAVLAALLVHAAAREAATEEGAGVDGALAGLALLQAHLARRLAEANWLARYPPGARMHAIAYAFGLRCAQLRLSVQYFMMPSSSQKANRLAQHPPCMRSCLPTWLRSGVQCEPECGKPAAETTLQSRLRAGMTWDVFVLTAMIVRSTSCRRGCA